MHFKINKETCLIIKLPYTEDDQNEQILVSIKYLKLKLAQLSSNLLYLTSLSNFNKYYLLKDYETQDNLSFL